MPNELPTDRLLPHNLEAEKAILGAILLHPPALFEAQSFLSTKDFYPEAHQLIYEAFLELQKAETAIDPLTVKNELQRTGRLEKCGGAAYVVSLTDGIPSGSMAVPHYASIVRENSARRRLIQLCSESMERAYRAEELCKETLSDLQLALLKLAEKSRKQETWIKAPDLVQKAYLEIESIAHRKSDIVGLDTGFKQLNRLCQGFHRGDLVIIAGRPSHGKTSLATNILTNGILKHAWRVGLFTIEMSAVEIMKRALYSEAEVDSYRAGGGYMTREDWTRMNAAAALLAETRLSVDESGGLTIMELRSRAQTLAIDGGLDLIVVDYLQLMAGVGRRNENRVAEISEISRGLKVLAKDLNVPIIALSQLNRGIENEKTRKPILADLRESGSIEQDADMVLFIWREELRSHRPEDCGKAELIIEKQRNGPTGNINLVFFPKITKFAESNSQQELPGYY
jgi:replicative DNA helicase